MMDWVGHDDSQVVLNDKHFRPVESQQRMQAVDLIPGDNVSSEQ